MLNEILFPETRHKRFPAMSMHSVDVPALAAKLAPLLGGEVIQSEQHYARMRVTRKDEPPVDFYITTMFGKAFSARIEIRGGHSSLIPLTHVTKIKMETKPHCTVDGTRDIAAIVKTINTKIIDMTLPQVKIENARLEQYLAAEKATTARIDTLRKRFPALNLRHDPAYTSTTISYSDGGSYITGRLNEDGSLRIDHASITASKVEAILKILCDG